MSDRRRPPGVYPEKRKGGYVLIKMKGRNPSSTTYQIWPPSKLPNGRGRLFKTYTEAHEWACDYVPPSNEQE